MRRDLEELTRKVRKGAYPEIFRTSEWEDDALVLADLLLEEGILRAYTPAWVVLEDAQAAVRRWNIEQAARWATGRLVR
jgi:hypothetical protein